VDGPSTASVKTPLLRFRVFTGMGEFMISLVLFGLFGVRQSMMRCAAPFVMTLVLDDPSTSSGDKQTCEQITGSHCRSHCLYARDRNRSVEVLQARDVVLVNVHCGEAETLGCVEAGLWLGGWGKCWALIMPYWQWGGGISSWEPVYSIRRGHERSAVRRRRTLDQKCD